MRTDTLKAFVLYFTGRDLHSEPDLFLSIPVVRVAQQAEKHPGNERITGSNGAT